MVTLEQVAKRLAITKSATRSLTQDPTPNCALERCRAPSPQTRNFSHAASLIELFTLRQKQTPPA